jgi:hypothetical protein
MSVQQDIERLIDWYEANRPGVKRITVNVTRETIQRFAGKPTPGMPLSYRGFEIVCKHKSRRDQQRAASSEKTD